ncbi:MAG: aminotransferase class I/II-fold pyridoxal phosphate-dependent enzyme [Pseudomonadota bacterium]
MSEFKKSEIKIESPFPKLHKLLSDIAPGQSPIDLTIGEPQHDMPSGVPGLLTKHTKDFAKYPPILGTDGLRQSIAQWIERRYPTLKEAVHPEDHILVLNGSREGLFSAAFTALERRSELINPYILMPNPFYQCYLAGALAAKASPHFLAARKEHGFMPDLTGLNHDFLSQTAAMYLCSPSNPEGAVATKPYLQELLKIARSHNFMLFFDECYSEIYFRTPPPSILEVSYETYGDFKNVLSFNSLSKRSNLPGLRSGFVAGDPDFIKAFGIFRAVACPQVPLPIQHVSEYIWSEETHVEHNRKLYREKFQCAQRILGDVIDFDIPQGGFFLWLDISKFGTCERATETFWKDSGVKVLPGAYLAKPDQTGANPASSYIRIALVQDLATTQEALERVADQFR